MVMHRSSSFAEFVPRPERYGRKAALGSSKACRNIFYQRKRYAGE